MNNYPGYLRNIFGIMGSGLKADSSTYEAHEDSTSPDQMSHTQFDPLATHVNLKCLKTTTNN